MNNKEFQDVLDGVLDKCTKTLGVKAGEYATDDRLHNFKIAAKLQHCTPITALAGMMCKHTVSVYDLIQKHEKGEEISQAMWDEKIGDSINYLILLSALIKEEKNIDIVDQLNDIIVATRGEAETILENANSVIATYGLITIQDFLDLLGVSPNWQWHHEDYSGSRSKMGWDDFSKARIEKNGNGFSIIVPKEIRNLTI